jgi:hypothetical protein
MIMNIKEQIRAEIERRLNNLPEDWIGAPAVYEEYMDILAFLDSLPEQPVSDHHEIEVEFRGEKVTISREFYRDGERNYSTSEQDDNAIWSALRAWCEKKGITPFELYPKQSEQPVGGLEEEIAEMYQALFGTDIINRKEMLYKETFNAIARHFAEWQKKRDDLETADLLAIAHLQGMEQKKAKMLEEAAKI